MNVLFSNFVNVAFTFYIITQRNVFDFNWLSPALSLAECHFPIENLLLTSVTMRNYDLYENANEENGRFVGKI